MAFNHPLDNLSEENVKKEIKKLKNIKNNDGFLYFLENYVFFPTASQGFVYGKENVFNWQRKFANDVLKGKYFISKKPRQVGNSITLGCYAIWRALLFPNQYIAIVSMSARESSSLLKKIKGIYNHLPNWLQMDKNQDAKTSLTFSHNGSTITSLPNNGNPVRGESASMIILDEMAFYENAGDILAAAVPAVSTGFLTDFSDDQLPSQLFIISTYPHYPGDNEYVRLLNEARQDPDGDFKLVDIETSDIPWYKSKEWHALQKKILGERRYAIEVLGQEPLDSENALLPARVLAGLIHVPPLRTDFLYPEDVGEDGYYIDMDNVLGIDDEFDYEHHYIKGLWIFAEPEIGKEYVIVCDVAQGKGGDYHTVLVMDPSINEMVAEYKNNKVSTETFKHIIEVLCEFYNNAKLSIENNSMGSAIVDYFVYTKEYENFYWHRKSKKQYTPGFPMSVATRMNSISYMAAMMERGELKVKSLRIINELRNFGYKPNGRIEALSGHDDLVMALAQYCYLQHAGFAVVDDSFGELLEEDADEANMTEKERRVSDTLKYYENEFDLDSEQLEIIKMMKSMGHVDEDALHDQFGLNNVF